MEFVVPDEEGEEITCQVLQIAGASKYHRRLGNLSQRLDQFGKDPRSGTRLTSRQKQQSCLHNLFVEVGEG